MKPYVILNLLLRHIPMRLRKLNFILIIVWFITAQFVSAQSRFLIKNLPPIPDHDGFAGSLAGVSHGVLLVAGGSNFPNGGRPWSGGTKTWYDTIFALESSTGKWKKVGKLPHSLGYAVTVSWKNAVVCVGGSNQLGHVSSAFMMRWENYQVVFEQLPNLPVTLANACGALIGNVLYVAGGLETPSSTEALKTFYALDLAAFPRVWTALPTWEGEGRMLSVAASTKEAFYLVSGTSLLPDKATGAASRVYLREVHCYRPATHRWERLPDVPSPVVAAASPAYVVGNQIVVLGGDTGEFASKTPVLKDRHPGFSKNVLGFSLTTKQWEILQNFPVDIRANAETHPNESTYLPVTTPMVYWKGAYVIPGGEARPGTRTPRVLWITPLK